MDGGLAAASLALALITAISVFTQESYGTETIQASIEMDPLYPSAGFTQAVNFTNANNNGAGLHEPGQLPGSSK
ncbi:MAG: hypothetical protein WDO18_00770 [Acidobacteriota bacterium]